MSRGIRSARRPLNVDRESIHRHVVRNMNYSECWPTWNGRISVDVRAWVNVQGRPERQT